MNHFEYKITCSSLISERFCVWEWDLRACHTPTNYWFIRLIKVLLILKLYEPSFVLYSEVISCCCFYFLLEYSYSSTLISVVSQTRDFWHLDFKNLRYKISLFVWPNEFILYFWREASKLTECPRFIWDCVESVFVCLTTSRRLLIAHWRKPALLLQVAKNKSHWRLTSGASNCFLLTTNA